MNDLQIQVMRAAQHTPPTLPVGDQLVAALAWHVGANYALARIAERADELDLCWRSLLWRPYHVQVADRLAEFAACAARAGRPEYKGGPVQLW